VGFTKEGMRKKKRNTKIYHLIFPPKNGKGEGNAMRVKGLGGGKGKNRQIVALKGKEKKREKSTGI